MGVELVLVTSSSIGIAGTKGAVKGSVMAGLCKLCPGAQKRVVDEGRGRMLPCWFLVHNLGQVNHPSRMHKGLRKLCLVFAGKQLVLVSLLPLLLVLLVLLQVKRRG